MSNSKYNVAVVLWALSGIAISACFFTVLSRGWGLLEAVAGLLCPVWMVCGRLVDETRPRRPAGSQPVDGTIDA